MYNENLLLKPKPIEEHQEMIFRSPIDKSDNRPPFNVLHQKGYIVWSAFFLGSITLGMVSLKDMPDAAKRTEDNL